VKFGVVRKQNDAIAVIQELKQMNENLLQTMKDGDKPAILEADNAFHS
jgi:hypothetical protein